MVTTDCCDTPGQTRISAPTQTSTQKPQRNQIQGQIKLSRAVFTFWAQMDVLCTILKCNETPKSWKEVGYVLPRLFELRQNFLTAAHEIEALDETYTILRDALARRIDKHLSLFFTRHNAWRRLATSSSVLKKNQPTNKLAQKLPRVPQMLITVSLSNYSQVHADWRLSKPLQAHLHLERHITTFSTKLSLLIDILFSPRTYSGVVQLTDPLDADVAAEFGEAIDEFLDNAKRIEDLGETDLMRRDRLVDCVKDCANDMRSRSLSARLTVRRVWWVWIEKGLREAIEGSSIDELLED